MADVIIGAKLQLDANDGVKSMQSFKKEIRDAQEALLAMTDKFGATSKQAQEAAKRVAQLKDKLGDAKSLVDAFNPDQKFRALSQSLGGVLGGFSALTGAMGLLGVESDQVQKQLLKVQSAMALSQGLNQVGDAIQSFKNLGVVVGDYVVKAFTTLRGAIIATGIGALLVAIGLLISNFDKIKESLFGVSRASKAAAKSAEEGAAAEQKKLEALSEQENTLRLSGKTEEQIRKLKIAQTNEVIAQREQQLLASQELAASQIKAAERNRNILKGIIDFLTKPIKWLNDTVGKIAAFFGGDDISKGLEKVRQETNAVIANYFFDPEDVKKEGDEAVAELKRQIIKLKNERDGFILGGIGKGGDKPVEKLKRDDTATDPAVLAEVGKAELILGTRQKLNESLISSEATRRGIEKANSENAIRDAEAEAAAKLAIAESVGNALNVLSDLVGRQTAAGKVLGIASALINTYVGVTKALSAGPPPLNFIQAATVLVAGLAAVKNIVKVQVPGQGSISAPSVSTPISAPLQSSPQVTNTRLDAGQLNQIGNAANPVRAFVVEHDITTNQERIRRLNRAARI